MRRFLIAFTLTLLVTLLWIGLAGCPGSSTIRVPAEDLLLDDLSVFPAGWSITSEPRSARHLPHVLQDQGAIDFADVEFAPPNGTQHWSRPTAAQIVWNFGNSLYATLEFYRRFRPSGPTLSKEELRGWSYHSEVADRFRLYCEVVEPIPEVHIEGGWTSCEAVGQYREFISTFGTPIGVEYNMTMEDLERILKAIDERMARYLKGDAR